MHILFNLYNLNVLYYFLLSSLFVIINRVLLNTKLNGLDLSPFKSLKKLDKM